jgi:hypothetical protein
MEFMKNSIRCIAAFSLLSTSGSQPQAGELPIEANGSAARRGENRASTAVAAASPTRPEPYPASVELPPPPSSVTDLKFSEFFKQPVGPRGMEYTEKTRNLDGEKVRILGYMVKQSAPAPWTILLSPVPITLHEKEQGFAEDLPLAVVHVSVERNATPIVPHTPGLLLLTGRLSLGNRIEADGRISMVRLELDPPTSEQRKALAAFAGNVQTISTNTHQAAQPTPK